jgi:hypothetical protein
LAFDVVGINNIIEFSPILLSVKVDEVALAVNVILPVEFNLPSIVLFNACDTTRKCNAESGIEIGTLRYWFVAIIHQLF